MKSFCLTCAGNEERKGMRNATGDEVPSENVHGRFYFFADYGMVSTRS